MFSHERINRIRDALLRELGSGYSVALDEKARRKKVWSNFFNSGKTTGDVMSTLRKIEEVILFKND